MPPLLTAAAKETMIANLETPVVDATPPPIEDNAAESLDTTADNAVDESLETAASDTESVETPETETDLEASTEVDEDPLAEFEDRPLTRADIDRMLPRVSREARDLLEKSETARAQYLSERMELGGDPGIAFAKAVVPHLYNPAPDKTTADAVLDQLTEANLPLVQEMGNRLIELSLSDERTAEGFGNKLALDHFGEGYDLARLEELVEWHKRGLMDEDAFKKAYEQVNKPSARETQLEQQLAAVNKKLEELGGKVDSGENAQQERAREQAESYVSERILKKITPIAEKLGWMPKEGDPPQLAKAKQVFAEAFSYMMDKRSLQTPERKMIDHLIKQGSAMSADGKPGKLLDIQLFNVENKALADFIEMSRALQPMFVESLRLHNAPKNGKPQSEAKPKVAPLPKPQTNDNGEKIFDPNRVKSLDEQYIASIRDAGVKVGQR